MQKYANQQLTILIMLLLMLAACTTPQEATPVLSTETPSIAIANTPAATPVPTEPFLTRIAATIQAPNPTAYECVPEDRKFGLPAWPNTDFCQHDIDYAEIESGGVSRDRIPSINAPVFQTIEDGNLWMDDSEPVIVVNFNDDARAYPLQVLVWHEIVNDTIGGQPALITYCPLCNSGLVFSRVVDERELTFGTTGNLRNADLIMYDHETESWWQQFTGEAIVGDMLGNQIELLAASLVSWADFKAQYPTGIVLFPDTGYEREYGETPYVNLDYLGANSARGYAGEPDRRLPIKMRVVAVAIDNAEIAYGYDTLSQLRVVNDVVADVPIVVFWKSGTLSALNNQVIAESKDVGSGAAFGRIVNNQTLTFSQSFEDGAFVDNETGSIWNIFGTAISGPLEGAQLPNISAHESFWFAWAAFHPETAIYTLPDTQ